LASGRFGTLLILRMRRGRYNDPRRRLFEPVSGRMRTSLPRAQCICPRRKNFDGGDWCASSHHSGAMETGVRRKSSLRAAKPRKSRALLGGARKCELSGSGWWSQTESNRRPLHDVSIIWGFGCVTNMTRNTAAHDNVAASLNSIAERSVPSAALRRHATQHRNLFINVVHHKRVVLTVVSSV